MPPSIEELSQHPEWAAMMHPDTHPGITADWLDEHDRPDLALLARNHRDRTADGLYAPHPEDEAGGNWSWPRTGVRGGFDSTGINPVWNLSLMDAGVRKANGSAKGYRPHVTWVMGPRGEGTNRVYESPLTREQFSQFLTHAHRTGLYDTKTLKKWAAHGVKNGWIGRGKTKLARKQPEPQMGMAGAVADRTSAQTQQRAELARQVMKEAGLTPAAVRQVLAHEGEAGLRAAVLIAIAKHVHPARTRYAAAWYGLLSGERRLAVFHPHDKGGDLVHIIQTPAASDQVAGYMQQAGVPRFVIDGKGTGSHVYVFDPKGQMNDTIARIAGGLNGSHTAIRGFGYRLGAGEGSDADTGAAGGVDARAIYRDTIRQYEQAAGL